MPAAHLHESSTPIRGWDSNFHVNQSAFSFTDGLAVDWLKIQLVKSDCTLTFPPCYVFFFLFFLSTGASYEHCGLRVEVNQWSVTNFGFWWGTWVSVTSEIQRHVVFKVSRLYINLKIPQSESFWVCVKAAWSINEYNYVGLFINTLMTRFLLIIFSLLRVVGSWKSFLLSYSCVIACFAISLLCCWLWH